MASGYQLMDVVKQKREKTNLFKERWHLLAAGIAVVCLLFLWVTQVSSSVSVSRNELLIAPVLQGDLNVVIDGYGVLTSDKQQLITSFSAATVKEIVLKPGASVTTNSVIVRLENPELEQQVENAEQELTQLKANLRQLKLSNQREKLNEEAGLAEIKARLETASLKRKAEEQLVTQGIVSDLNFQQTVLDEKQLRQRIEILTRRNAQLSLVHEESINIQLERIKQQEGRLKIANSRLDKLTVRAGFDGVLQRLSVELGQSLSAGSEVALIGSVTDLIALIRVPQSQAQQVVLGQSAVIDTRRDKITGVVSRIDPIVADNTVEIEIALPDELPASARPQLSVDGQIIADSLSNVLYMKRPAGAKSNGETQLYRLQEETSHALLGNIRFGVQAGQYMQIRSGAALGDQFIISDLTNLHTTNQQITIE
jgi:HlyD family secretion protein